MNNATSTMARQQAGAQVPPVVWAGLATVAMTILGTFLPWVSTPFGGVSGLSGDGIIVLIAALAAGGSLGYAAYSRQIKRSLAAGVLGPAAIAAAVSLYDLINVKKSAAGLGGSGSGLYICLVGALLMAGVGGFMIAKGDR